MNALSAYGRLVWRPHTAVHLYLVVCLVGAACMWVGWLHGLMGEEHAAVALRRTSIVLLVAPLAMGAFAVSPVRELCHAQLTWHLPGVRRHMGLALASIAALSAALTVLGLSLLGWLVVPVVPALGVALFAFSLGLIAFDWLHPRRALVRGTCALVVGLLLFSEALWSAASTWPIATTLIGVAGAAWLLPQCVSRDALRHKGLVKVRRMMGLALTAVADLDTLPEPQDRAPARPPRLAPRGDRPWMWVRAAHYELFGWSATGSLWRVGALVLGLPFILCSVDVASSVLETGSLRAALEHLHGSLTRTDASLGRTPEGLDFSLAMGGAMLLFFTGMIPIETLKPARLQPISRPERAEITWRLHLVVDLGVLGLLALGLFGLSELLALLGGFEGRGGPAPGWLRPIAALLVLTPLARCWQYRRRGLGAEGRDGGSMLILMVGVALIVMFATGISKLWSLHSERLSGATWALVVLALLAATHLSFRLHLRRTFARCDLI